MLTSSSLRKLVAALLSKRFGNTRKNRHRTSRKDSQCFRPVLEMLEDRLAPSLGTCALLEGPASGADSDIVVAPGAWSATSNASWLHTTS
jgi:hypothetical protein